MGDEGEDGYEQADEGSEHRVGKGNGKFSATAKVRAADTLEGVGETEDGAEDATKRCAGRDGG